MVTKRGQAAMEFLMTYGWALLVVLVAIGALAFFGVLNPGQFLPDTCTMPPGISCLESQATGSNSVVTLVVQNGFGDNMDNVVWGLNITNVGTPINCAEGTGGSSPLVSGTSNTIAFDCSLVGGSGLSAGSNIKGDVYIEYSLAGSTLTHNKQGSVALKVE